MFIQKKNTHKYVDIILHLIKFINSKIYKWKLIYILMIAVNYVHTYMYKYTRNGKHVD